MRSHHPHPTPPPTPRRAASIPTLRSTLMSRIKTQTQLKRDSSRHIYEDHLPANTTWGFRLALAYFIASKARQLLRMLRDRLLYMA